MIRLGQIYLNQEITLLTISEDLHSFKKSFKAAFVLCAIALKFQNVSK